MTILKETCCDLKIVSRLLKSDPTPSRFSVSGLRLYLFVVVYLVPLNLNSSITENDVHLPHEMYTLKTKSDKGLNE